MLTLIIPFIINMFPTQIYKLWFPNIIWMMIMTSVMITKIYNPLTHFTMIYPWFQIDSMSIFLMTLTMWISSMMMLASQKIKSLNLMQSSLSLMIMILMIILMTTFSVSNIMFMYIMFESSLIPTMMIILGWGYQPERSQATMYLMLYTITASLPLLMSILMILNSSFNLNMSYPFFFIPSTMKNFLMMWWMMSILAFLAKMPMYMLHLWLPKAHVEAPVAGSMILAAILLKLGGYGLMRFMFMFIMMMNFMKSAMMVTPILGGIITSLICMRQSDMKSLIAYSSIGHMALLISALFSSSLWAMSGSLIMMIAHGLASSGMFSLAGMTYEYSKSRNMFMTKGLLSLFPSMSLMWFLLSCCNMGAPPSINILSEIMLLSSMIYISKNMFITIIMIAFLSTVYTLILYSSTQHGLYSNYLNFYSYYNQKNMNISLLHFFPIIMLIVKPALMLM